MTNLETNVTCVIIIDYLGSIKIAFLCQLNRANIMRISREYHKQVYEIFVTTAAKTMFARYALTYQLSLILAADILSLSKRVRY